MSTALAAALGVDLDAPASRRTTPRGAMVLIRRRDARGPHVTLSYRVQPLDAIRSGVATVVDKLIAIPGCPNRCPLKQFDTLLRTKLAPVAAG